MTPRMSPATVLRELARLLDVYARPKHWPPADEQVAHKWAEILSDVTPEQLATAVTDYLREDHEHMPKPGWLRVSALKVPRIHSFGTDVASVYADWERAGWQDPVSGVFTPCPVCGEKVREHLVRVNADGSEVFRLLMLHNHVAHAKAEIGYTGGALPGTGGRVEQRVVDHRPVTPAPGLTL